MMYVIIGLIAVILVFLIMYLCEHTRYKNLKVKNNQLQEHYNGLKNEFDLYRKSEQFKHQKEEETNEKIDDLHSGKLSADDILPKR